MSEHHSQQVTPPSEGSLPVPINIGGSPAAPHNSDDLAKRCRQLARSVGHGAVVEQQHGISVNTSSSSLGHESPSPARLSPNGSPARSPRLNSSLFPLSPSGKIQAPVSPRSSYPTPEGSFILPEIMEEGEGDPSQLRPSAPLSSALETDEEHSDHDHTGRGSRNSRTGSRMTALNSLKLGGHNLEEALLRSSLKDGVTHFEMDLTLADGELLVGSDPATLSPESTLSSMYIEPLLNVFQPAQPPTPSTGSFSHHRRRSSSSAAGHPFPVYAQQPLLLVMNLKTSPEISLQYLLYSITPLYDASLLTSYCANADLLTPGMITIVCTGVDARTRDEINSISPRYVFAEGTLAEEDDKMEGREVTPVSIGDLKEAAVWSGEGHLSEEQKLRVRGQVERAHAKGSKVFYRGVESAEVKEDLRAEGVDYL